MKTLQNLSAFYEKNQADLKQYTPEMRAKFEDEIDKVIKEVIPQPKKQIQITKSQRLWQSALRQPNLSGNDGPHRAHTPLHS